MVGVCWEQNSEELCKYCLDEDYFIEDWYSWNVFYCTRFC